MSFLTVFPFLRFDHGARALIANYRGQTEGRLVPAVFRRGTLTQITGKWSWLNTLDCSFESTNMLSNLSM